MPKVPGKKTTQVREHPRHVPVSEKNPSGITIVDRHPRRLPGTDLKAEEIESITRNYDRKGLNYPTEGRLKEYKDSDRYDELIAIWTDYFSKKFNTTGALTPNVIKALLASESEFQVAPLGNPKAFGIAQITKATLKILQDPNGEVRNFIFMNIRQKDLKNPNIAIPMGIRWLFRKKVMAADKLKREPTPEELILEYKGLLESKTGYKDKALGNFRKNYALLMAK